MTWPLQSDTTSDPTARHTPETMRRAFSAFCLLLVLVLAACGGGSDDEGDTDGFAAVLAEVEGLTGKDRQQKLVELAKEEGSELSLYTSMSIEQLDAAVGAFEDEFDIDVAFYRASGETVVPRLLEEAAADFHGADVVRINGLGMVNLTKEGALAPYSSPLRSGLVDGTAYGDDWTIDAFSTFVLSWNTKLVPEGEQPTSWEDLADPRFDGNVAIEAGDVSWYKELWEYWVEEQGKTPQEADDLFRQMASNAGIVRGHSLLAQLMSAEEFAVAPNLVVSVERLRKEGAPLAWKPVVEPIFPEGQGVALVKGAQHPAAAVLFVDWLLGPAQDLLVEYGSEPARKDLVTAPSAERRVVDFRSYAAEQEKWNERFDRLLATGKEVEDEG
jgi:iron(III) transport system substrate-binding protein